MTRKIFVNCDDGKARWVDGGDTLVIDVKLPGTVRDGETITFFLKNLECPK